MWSTRAWTFQEDMFSNRRLIFGAGSVRWECTRATWQEDREETLDSSGAAGVQFLSKPILKTKDIFAAPFPDFKEYNNLVAEYKRRKLGSVSDMLNAFSGIMTVLEYKFDEGFLCGLPVVNFDTALLWQPIGGAERVNVVKSYEVYPSWSWAGWHGKVDPSSLQRGSIISSHRGIVSILVRDPLQY